MIALTLYVHFKNPLALVFEFMPKSIRLPAPKAVPYSTMASPSPEQASS